MNEINSLTAEGTIPSISKQIKPMLGKKFCRLTVIEHSPKMGTSRLAFWMCKCDCGNHISVSGANLRKGNTRSCGCLKIEMAKLSNTTHGLKSCGKVHPVYESYSGMKKRCENLKDKEWKNYGGRGITVCERWTDPMKFIEDMLPSWKPGSTIERVNVNGNYEPSNCRWATRKEQARNTRKNRFLNVNGVQMAVSECSEIFGIPYRRLLARLNRGWSDQESVFGKPA